MADSGLRVTARRRFGQFLITKSPRVEIDGVPVGEASWRGVTNFPAGEGSHRLTVSFPYLGKPRCGEATTDVTVQPGQVLDVTYRPAWVIFNKGSLTLS